ncbi:hypothetical protein HYX10_00300 [Candidatus Woesearchaeota archaeon]|nr:hypothetical protein [Candidatus Woesearchaeota archaeon]
MKFEDFIQHGKVRKASPDVALAKSLVSTAAVDLKFLSALQVNSTSARKVMTNYYDVLRSILEAILAVEGYKVYSHEAFTYFLKDKGESFIAEKFDRFRRIRNSINYYGKDISAIEVKENAGEIVEMIQILKEKHLSGVK